MTQSRKTSVSRYLSECSSAALRSLGGGTVWQKTDRSTTILGWEGAGPGEQ